MFKRAQLSVAEQQTGFGARFILGLLTWVIILLFFFPVMWMG